MSPTAREGCLIVLDSWGNVIKTISGHHINGPWDMTAVDSGRFAALFVTNVLNGHSRCKRQRCAWGERLSVCSQPLRESGAPASLDSTVVASGFPERTDPNALVIGPTGVALDAQHRDPVRRRHAEKSDRGNSRQRFPG